MDEMRAGETLEALKQGILNRKQIIGEGTVQEGNLLKCTPPRSNKIPIRWKGPS